MYIDDLNMKGFHGKEDEARARFRRALETARENSVTTALKKTHIAVPEIQFLGEIIDKWGRRPNPDCVQGIRDFALPQTRKKLRGYLGLYNFLAPLERHAVTPGIRALQV